MVKKDALQERLTALAAIRHAPTTPEATALLRETLAKGPGLAVAKAAGVIADFARGAEGSEADGLGPSAARAEAAEAWASSLIPELLAAFARCCDAPMKYDKGAFGKIAIADALDRLECLDAAPFVRGVTFVQLEPVMNGVVDKAAALRARSLAALVRLRHPERLAWMADLLWDPWREARLGAAQAAAFDGSEAAEMLLRAKALAGDDDRDGRPSPADGGMEVLGAVFVSLLAMDAERNASFVARFLHDTDQADAVREQAAMALGECRRPAGLRELMAAWPKAAGGDERNRLAFAAALHGTDDALAALAAWLRETRSKERERMMATVEEIWEPGSPRFARLLEAMKADA